MSSLELVKWRNKSRQLLILRMKSPARLTQAGIPMGKMPTGKVPMGKKDANGGWNSERVGEFVEVVDA
jgi:hypothetical protein